jgi:hypothetical protein
MRPLSGQCAGRVVTHMAGFNGYHAIQSTPSWLCSGPNSKPPVGNMRTSVFALQMSAFGGKADMTFRGANVCF